MYKGMYQFFDPESGHFLIALGLLMFVVGVLLYWVGKTFEC